MSSGIDIKIGSSFDASGITEANKSLAKLAQDVGSANQQLRQATLKAAADINSYAEAADKACRAMGGGYKDASQFVKDAMGEYINASKSVREASSAFEDFNAVMRRAAEAVDKRNANIKQAAEVSKVLEKKQRELAAMTDTSSEAYKQASRNVEILKQALSSLGVKATSASKPVEAVPSRWRTALSSATGHVKGFASAVGRNLINIQAGFHMAARAVQTFVSVMSKGMEFERMTVQFKSLTGSMELAKSHMRDLQDLGRTPPFSLEQFAAASQAMLKMTGGMAGFKKEMQIVGDLAAATGNDIATVGRAFGLAYQVIRDGQDFGRAGQQLYSLGIMTKKQVSEFAELSKAGTDNAAVWEKLQAVFARYSGAMAETENTAKGIVEAIQGEATVAMTEFSAAVAEAATPALSGLLGFLKRINEDGTIEDWAERSAESLSGLAESISGIATVFGGVLKYIKGGAASAAGAIAAIGEDTGDGSLVSGQLKNAASTAKAAWNENVNGDEERKTRHEEIVADKKRKREEQATAAEAEAQRRQKRDISRAQESTNLSKMDADEQVDYIERRIAELQNKRITIEVKEERDAASKQRHDSESVDVEENRIAADTTHESEYVDVKENRIASDTTHDSESVDVEENRISSDTSHEGESVDVKENRIQSDITHASESVDVKENRIASDTTHDPESVEVKENRIASDSRHPNESVQVKEDRLASNSRHQDESVQVKEKRAASSNRNNREVVEIDADISALEEKLKKAKEAQDKIRAEDFNAYKESGSTDTFEQWRAEKKKAAEEKLKSDRELFATFQRDSGIDNNATADTIDIKSEAFTLWRTEHDKKVAQERADNLKTAELKQKAEISAANEASRIRIENAREELKAAQDSASSKQYAASNAQTEFDHAFAMYRSADKGAAQIAEERDYAADYKQLKKDASRYGGKWRIDELSNLIAAGDTQGQAAKLEEWRKSKSFTPEVESMVRAAAADDAKTTAEDELRKIAKNTESLSNKLDELLQVK